MNFDANWDHHLFDEEKRREYEEDRRRVENMFMDLMIIPVQILMPWEKDNRKADPHMG